MHEALVSAPHNWVGIVAQAYNPSTLEVEAGWSEVQGQYRLHIDIKANLDCMRPDLKIFFKKEKKEKKICAILVIIHLKHFCLNSFKWGTYFYSNYSLYQPIKWLFN